MPKVTILFLLMFFKTNFVFCLDTLFLYQTDKPYFSQHEYPTLDSFMYVDYEKFGSIIVLELNEDYFQDDTQEFISKVYFVDQIVDILRDDKDKYYFLSGFEIYSMIGNENLINDPRNQVSIIINSLNLINKFLQPEYVTFLFDRFLSAEIINISIDNSVIYSIGDKKVILFGASFSMAVIGIDFDSRYNTKFNKLILPISSERSFRRIVKYDRDPNHAQLEPWKLVKITNEAKE